MSEEWSVDELLTHYQGLQVSAAKNMTEAEQFWIELGFDPSEIETVVAPHDDLSIRGFENLSPELSEKIKGSIDWMSNRLGIDLTLNDNPDKVKEFIRNKTEIAEIEKIQNLDQDIKTVKDIVDYPRNLSFNREFESSNHFLTHIVYDIETGKESNTVSMGLFNYEAKRLTIARKSHRTFFVEARQENGLIIQYLETPYIYEAFLISDIETTIASICLSAIQQGHKAISTVFSKYRIAYVNTGLFAQVLNHKRKSMYLAHNTSAFDILHLQNEYRKNKHNISYFKQFVPETVKITEVYKETGYVLRLGNSQIGFRFKISANKRNMRVANIKIAPLQKESYPLNYNCDTSTLAKGLTLTKEKEHLIRCFCHDKTDKNHRDGLHISYFQSSALDVLSQNSIWHKKELKTDKKAFDPEDFVNIVEGKLNESTQYLIYDLYSNLVVYEDLLKFIKLKEFEEILHTSIPIEYTPLSSSITSPATISKKMMFAKLESETGLTKREMEKNIKDGRRLQRNFEGMKQGGTYKGGLVSAYVHGLVSRNKETLEKIWYTDFASLYPHTAWLIEAWKLYKLAVTGELIKHISNDVPRAIKIITKKINRIAKKIKNNEPFVKKDLAIAGNISFRTSLYLLVKPEKDDVRANGNIKITIQDYIVAVLDYHFKHGLPIRKILSKVNVNAIEYIDVEYDSEYGKEFFTELYLTRKEIKDRMNILKKQGKKHSKEYVELNSKQLLIKLIMNSAYGIASEGISTEDHTGILFTPIIANAITGTARMVNRLAKMIVEKHDGLPIYGDTDSIIFRATEKNFTSIVNMFSKTIELKDEFPRKTIDKIYVAGLKKYGILFADNTSYFKVHSASNFYRDNFNYAIEKTYRLLMENKRSLKHIVKETSKDFATHHIISLRSSRDSKYKGLAKFNKGHVVHEFDYEGLPMKFIYHVESDSYLITNTKEIELGQFGSYLNATPSKQKHKLLFFISAPIKSSFDEFLYWFLEEFYYIGMDNEFKRGHPLIGTHEVYDEALKHVKKEIREHPDFYKKFKSSKFTYFKGLEFRFKAVLDHLEVCERQEKFLENYFGFSEKKVRRLKIGEFKDGENNYKILVEKQTSITQTKLVNYFAKLSKSIKVDGFSYAFSMSLPKYEFSSDLRANLSKFYSRNILNLAVVASKIHYLTHTRKKPSCAYIDDGIAHHAQDCKNPECKINKIYYSDKSHLPTPRKNTSIIIPLGFKVIPQVQGDKIRKLDSDLIDDETLEDLETRGVIEWTKRGYKVINFKKWDRWLEKWLKYEWLQISAYDRTFSVSIEAYNSFNYSGVLSISVLPEKVDYTKRRVLKGILRLNPTSHKMLNTKLFKTTLERLFFDRNNFDVILRTLLEDTDFQIFERNYAVTRDHALEKQHIINAITYQIFLKEMMLRNSKRITTTLVEVTESEQIELNDNFAEYQILQSRILELSKKMRPSELKDYVEHRKNFMVSPHRSSTGFTANDFAEKTATTIYIKDNEWYENKLLRMSRKRKIKDKVMSKLLEHRFDKIMRFEIAQFGFDTILKTDSQNRLEKLKKFFKSTFKKIGQKFKVIYNILSDIEIPKFLISPIGYQGGTYTTGNG